MAALRGTPRIATTAAPRYLWPGKRYPPQPHPGPEHRRCTNARLAGGSITNNQATGPRFRHRDNRATRDWRRASRCRLNRWRHCLHIRGSISRALVLIRTLLPKSRARGVRLGLPSVSRRAPQLSQLLYPNLPATARSRETASCVTSDSGKAQTRP